MKKSVFVIIFIVLFFTSCQERIVRKPLISDSSSQGKIKIKIDIPESAEKIFEAETADDGIYIPEYFFDSNRRKKYNLVLAQLDTYAISRLVSGRNGVRVLCVSPNNDSYSYKFIWDDEDAHFVYCALDEE